MGACVYTLVYMRGHILCIVHTHTYTLYMYVLYMSTNTLHLSMCTCAHIHTNTGLNQLLNVIHSLRTPKS